MNVQFVSGVQSKICILPEEAFISASLKQDGAFEHDMVNSIVKAMTVFSDATLIGMLETCSQWITLTLI